MLFSTPVHDGPGVSHLHTYELLTIDIYTHGHQAVTQAHISSARNTPDLYVCVSTSLGIASDQSSSEPITRLYTERDTLVYLDT